MAYVLNVPVSDLKKSEFRTTVKTSVATSRSKTGCRSQVLDLTVGDSFLDKNVHSAPHDTNSCQLKTVHTSSSIKAGFDIFNICKVASSKATTTKKRLYGLNTTRYKNIKIYRLLQARKRFINTGWWFSLCIV